MCLTCNEVGDVHGGWALPQAGHQLIGVEYSKPKGQQIGQDGSKDEGKYESKLPARELVCIKICGENALHLIEHDTASDLQRTTESRPSSRI